MRTTDGPNGRQKGREDIRCLHNAPFRRINHLSKSVYAWRSERKGKKYEDKMWNENKQCQQMKFLRTFLYLCCVRVCVWECECAWISDHFKFTIFIQFGGSIKYEFEARFPPRAHSDACVSSCLFLSFFLRVHFLTFVHFNSTPSARTFAAFVWISVGNNNNKLKMF